MDFPTQVALLAGSLRSASPVFFSVSGLSALVPVVQVCLRAARVFCLVGGSLSAGFVWGSGFTVLLFILLGPDLALSLSLSAFLAPASRPWGLLVGACVCLGYFHGLDCPSSSHGGLPIGIPTFLSGSLPVALSHLPGGVRLFCFAGRPSSPFFWLSGALVALPGSLLFILPGFGSLSSQFPVVGLVLCFLPCGLHPVSLSLWPVGCSPVSSVTVPSCVLSWSLGFSIPWQFPRPGLLFPGSRILQLPPPWYCGGIWILPSAPLGCFILLSRLVSCFCFLRRLFRLFSWFQGFLSYFSDLVFCSSQSCLGLQWFWSSCPFRCWGSRLPLPIAVFRISSRGLGSFLFPDFVPGWLVLRLLRWCSAVSSCFPAFSRLADPCSFYSPALSLCSILGGSALHVFLLLAFGPLGWFFILSPSPWSTRCFCWSVPTLPSCPVGPPGSPRLALPLRSGVLLPGCTCSVSSVCIDLASFLSCSSGVLRPGGCFPWLVSSSMVVFVRSSAVVLGSVVCLQSVFPTLVVVMLFPLSSFHTPSVSVGCVLGAFAMGSP